MGLTDKDVREVLRIVEDSALDELRIETEGLRLYVRRAGVAASAAPPAPTPAPAPASTSVSAPADPPELAAESPAAAPSAAEGEEVPAPMMGIFYRAPSPGEPPFVEVGSPVEPDTVIGLVEVMKLMNSVTAETSGVVTEICAENAALVEYGQPLIRVAPER